MADGRDPHGVAVPRLLPGLAPPPGIVRVDPRRHLEDPRPGIGIRPRLDDPLGIRLQHRPGQLDRLLARDRRTQRGDAPFRRLVIAAKRQLGGGLARVGRRALEAEARGLDEERGVLPREAVELESAGLARHGVGQGREVAPVEHAGAGHRAAFGVDDPAGDRPQPPLQGDGRQGDSIRSLGRDDLARGDRVLARGDDPAVIRPLLDRMGVAIDALGVGRHRPLHHGVGGLDHQIDLDPFDRSPVGVDHRAAEGGVRGRVRTRGLADFGSDQQRLFLDDLGGDLRLVIGETDLVAERFVPGDRHQGERTIPIRPGVTVPAIARHRGDVGVRHRSIPSTNQPALDRDPLDDLDRR